MAKRKHKLDFHSVNFKLWLNFTMLAILMLLLIWFLEIFFVNNYYEQMKTRETTKLANKIRTEYINSDYNNDILSKLISNTESSNDVTILIRTLDGERLLDSTGTPVDTDIFDSHYGASMERLCDKLISSQSAVASDIAISRSKKRTLEYACVLTNATKISYEKGSYALTVMYIFSPLYPVRSTVIIMRSQLVYITIISLLLALLFGLIFASRISKPIKDITRSAEKMGKGDFTAKFEGGSYTEIQELAEALSFAESEMARTDQYQKDLIANVSHDLRTPLTMIRSYAEMIRDLSGDNPEKREKHLNVIIEETDRLNSLVSDMLNLSRMQSKRMVLATAPFDISASVQSIVDSYQVLRETEGYHLKYRIVGKGPFVVVGDEARIKQVIGNFMSNAVKYCGDDKAIYVTVRRVGKKIRFSVTDHGQGISKDELPHVWDKYYKSSNNHARLEESSGLGLSIAKEILNLHKAGYGIDSKVGKGSTFWFELPILNTPTRFSISSITKWNKK